MLRPGVFACVRPRRPRRSRRAECSFDGCLCRSLAAVHRSPSNDRGQTFSVNVQSSHPHNGDSMRHALPCVFLLTSAPALADPIQYTINFTAAQAWRGRRSAFGPDSEIRRRRSNRQWRRRRARFCSCRLGPERRSPHRLSRRDYWRPFPWYAQIPSPAP